MIKPFSEIVAYDCHTRSTFEHMSMCFCLVLFYAAFVCSFIIQGQTRLLATSANLIHDVCIRLIHDLWFTVAKTVNFFSKSF